MSHGVTSWAKRQTILFGVNLNTIPIRRCERRAMMYFDQTMKLGAESLSKVSRAH
jgi:hypothetical protein